MVHRVDQERGAAGCIFQRFLQGAELAFGPFAIDNDSRRFRRAAENARGVATQDNYGWSHRGAIIDGDLQCGFSSETCQRFREWQRFGAACGQDNGNDLFAFAHPVAAAGYKKEAANSSARR